MIRATKRGTSVLNDVKYKKFGSVKLLLLESAKEKATTFKPTKPINGNIIL